ncbi:Tetratricopeptide TPR_2 repeat-containing protein [Thalassoporum mexicanum PCC 7367]|uniref:tetratricopeptide repeat protein n=1 Tax=Thalassoporum mexicanum TaxID=3457544 RepID=UPI00029FCD51|nr:tetratricopeptide repeat protein [Pseudanabaena sp. PCC 7367]AFY68573.1 Tetratricopeptide TPR_2 repeat-containing protein [Pseudanabaena sp. PCC 7367]
MRDRLFLFAILAGLTCGGATVAPVQAQALLPHTLKVNFTNLENQGLALAGDAAQLAQFRQYELALARAKLAVQLAPQAFQTQAILGSIYLRQGEYEKAIAILNKSYSLKQDNPAVLFSLGSAYIRIQEYPKAIENIKAGLKIVPKEPTAIFDLGNAYFLSNRYDEAIEQYEIVTNLDEKFWAAANNIGLVEYERGNQDKAVRFWEQAVNQAEKGDEQAAEPKLALAVVLYQAGNRDRALKLGEEALGIDPRYGKLDFLKENLWGEKLLDDTKPLLAEETLAEIVAESLPDEEE